MMKILDGMGLGHLPTIDEILATEQLGNLSKIFY